LEVREKYYDTSDFEEIIDIGGEEPEVEFSRVAIVCPETSITRENTRTFEFKYTANNNYFKLKSE